MYGGLNVRRNCWWYTMEIEIIDNSDHWLAMYSLKIYDASEKEKDQIHQWIIENIKSYNVPTYGFWYLFEFEEDAIAAKLRWS